MKQVLFLILFCFFLGYPSPLLSYVNPAPYFCQKQGYFFQEQGIQGKCLFPDGNQCDAWAFLTRVCGQQYLRQIPCVSRGQPMFLEFDQCCRGLQPIYSNKKIKFPICTSPSHGKPR